MPRQLLCLLPLFAFLACVLLAPRRVAARRPPTPAGKEAAKEVTNSVGMKLVRVAAGKFQMGSSKEEQDEVIAAHEKNVGGKASAAYIDFFRAEGPVHEVKISKAFYLGVYEVTQKQFKEVMGYNPSHFSIDGTEKAGAKYPQLKPAGGKDKVNGLTNTEREALPVENVSYEEAVEFCKKLSELKKEKDAKRVYGLPTEAQWEYACRGGTTTPYHFGKTLDISQANFGPMDEVKGSLGRTSKVGSYKPNGFGLFDMHGNVFEWCSDWFGQDYYKNSPKDDPAGPKKDSRRIGRGGHWSTRAAFCRSAYRARMPPEARTEGVGFRVALVASD